jgi:hypothetical protein
MKMTRRQLATSLIATAALAQSGAAPANPEAELQTSRDQVKAAGTVLGQFELGMAVEPAFAFRA